MELQQARIIVANLRAKKSHHKMTEEQAEATRIVREYEAAHPESEPSPAAEGEDDEETDAANPDSGIADEAEYDKLLSESKDPQDALFEWCFKMDVAYDPSAAASAVKACALTGAPAVREYKKKIDRSKRFFSQIKRETFSRLAEQAIVDQTMTDDDKANRQKVMTILGYDPFKGNPVAERPLLYRDLAGMLSENMRDDIPRQKAALSIVQNYRNINSYQEEVKELISSGAADDYTTKKINEILKTISNIQQSVNQTTKENGFTGGQTIGSGGRGMLSDVMNKVEDMHYDAGITNFFDVATSKSLAEIAKISDEAVAKQLALTDTDYANVLGMQAKRLREALKSARASMEMLRLCKTQITKQRLLDQLAETYRRKGLSEQDIEDFVEREYKRPIISDIAKPEGEAVEAAQSDSGEKSANEEAADANSAEPSQKDDELEEIRQEADAQNGVDEDQESEDGKSEAPEDKK